MLKDISTDPFLTQKPMSFDAWNIETQLDSGLEEIKNSD